MTSVNVTLPSTLLPHLPTKFNDTLGALLIGLIISTTLFGLTTLQTYLYFLNYIKDRLSLKFLVVSLWILDFMHTILVAHASYHYLVVNFANPLGLIHGEWSLIVEVAVTTTVTLIVQSFFAYRVYKLSEGNWWLAILIVGLALGHSGLGIASTVRLFQIGVFSNIPHISDILSSTLIVMAVNDVLITFSLCYYLRKTQKSMQQRHDAIRLLIVYSIETGLLTSVVVIADAIFALTMPGNWVFIGVELCLAKLYTNSFLTILNSRQTLRRKFGRRSANEGSKPAQLEDQGLVTISWEEHQNPSRDIHLLEIKKTNV